MGSRPSSFKFSLTNPDAYDGRAVIYSLDQLLAFPDPEWLIPGLIPKAAIVGLVGPPGVGKSMLALDWALCVATGTPWLGHPVDRQFVLYVAAEGHSGLKIRADAWLRHHDIAPYDASFGLTKGRIIMSPGDETHEALFERVEDELRVRPGLVVIDTLARVIGGDENGNMAMDAFLAEAERWVSIYGATVLIVHHKNATGIRERGHTSFRGTVGALYFLDPVPRHKGLLRLDCVKQRDAKAADPIGLRHEDVEDTASIVLICAELPVKGESGAPKTTFMRKVDMLTLLGSHGDGLTTREWQFLAQMPKRTFFRRVKQLMRDSDIYRDDTGRYFATPSNVDLAEESDE